ASAPGSPSRSPSLLPPSRTRPSRRIVGGALDQAPAQRRRSLDLDHRLEPKLDQSFGTWERRRPLPVPDDLAPPRALQRPAPLEADEQQARSRLDRQVPERIEHRVARVVGEEEGVLPDRADEPRTSPAMRGVGAARRVAGADEKGIGRLDPPPLRPGQPL